MIWDSKKWVSRTPVISAVLVESANLSQLNRIWAEHSAQGQSLQAWLCVGLALLVRWNFYRVTLPDHRLARICVIGSMVLNTALIASVVWFNG